MQDAEHDMMLNLAVEMYDRLGLAPSWDPDVSVQISEQIRLATGSFRVAEVTGPISNSGRERAVFVLTESTGLPSSPVRLWRVNPGSRDSDELIFETTAQNVFKYGTALTCLLDTVRDQMARWAMTSPEPQ